jgi:hypothetical protein
MLCAARVQQTVEHLLGLRIVERIAVTETPVEG